MTKKELPNTTITRATHLLRMTVFAVLCYYLFWRAIDSGSYWHYGLLLGCGFFAIRSLIKVINPNDNKSSKAQ